MLHQFQQTIVSTNLLTTPPLSLYIHIPWCVEKCPYCDFNSHALKSKIPEQDYIQALIADLDADIERFNLKNRPLHSIFIYLNDYHFINSSSYS